MVFFSPSDWHNVELTYRGLRFKRIKSEKHSKRASGCRKARQRMMKSQVLEEFEIFANVEPEGPSKRIILVKQERIDQTDLAFFFGFYMFTFYL